MVILVDDNDKPIGEMEKIEAHEKALLHRAFSVFIFNSKNEILMQQRALGKYHSAGLWTNTCCSHPFPGEETLDAANRRLMEEMGMESELKYLFKFKYKAPFDNNLSEHEIDHVFIGNSDDLPDINLDEVNSYKYMTINEIEEDIKVNPDDYTAWFKIIFDRFCEEYDFCK
ncbi:MAG: isopentenyl-diphosphate Delta-isomerase [Bacteroidales bacterium]|nr:isopentenyl-diphosphate Delta-isomerase [Bacteroidales bacterium]